MRLKLRSIQHEEMYVKANYLLISERIVEDPSCYLIIYEYVQNAEAIFVFVIDKNAKTQPLL